MQLILIRHGRPERVDHDPNGADPGLTDLGHRQAEAMAGFLRDEDVSAMYVSPQRRALETAQPLAKELNLVPAVVRGIAEFDLGHPTYIPGEERGPLEGVELEAIMAAATAPEFLDRVRTSIDKIIDDHRDETVVAVCHGGVISILLNDVLDLPLSKYHNSRYTSVTRIGASTHGTRSMLSFNESHWLGKLA